MKPTSVIEVTVDTAGEVKIEAIGFKGADCEAATAFLEEALGQCGRRTRKVECYRRTQTQSQSQAQTQTQNVGYTDKEGGGA